MSTQAVATPEPDGAAGRDPGLAHGGEDNRRRGKKAQWRTALTRDQVGSIVAAHRDTMRRFRYVPAGY